MTATINNTITATISSSIPSDGGVDPILATDHPNLVAMFDMSRSGSTLIDVSPNGNDGTIAGATTVPGIIGDGLSFDGINDRVTFTDFYAPSSGAYVVWALAGNDGVTQWYGQRQATTGSDHHHFSFTKTASNQFQLKVVGFSPSYFRTITTNSAFSGGDFLVGFQSTGSGYDIYVNGVSEAFSVAGAQGADDGLWVDTIGGSSIQWGFNGPWESSSSFYFKAIMDQARLFDRHLTSNEHSALYNEGTP